MRGFAPLFFLFAVVGVAQESPSTTPAPPTAAAPPATPTPPVRATVYSIHDPAAVDHFRANAPVVRAMVDRLITAVTAQPDVVKAWSSIATPDDVVGIKVSAVGGELFTTHQAVVNAIVDGLAAAGVPRAHIVVWDRDLSALERAGYRPRAAAYQVTGIDAGEGYDPKAEVTAPLLGKLVWGDLGFIPHRGANPIAADSFNTSDVSHVAKIVSTQVTKIINVPVLSQSETTGIAGCLYNMTLPNIDNWRRFTQYESIGASAMAELYSNPRLSGKVVLHLMDGLVGLYAGGPEGQPHYAKDAATLFASRDPVALDSVALQQLEQWRANSYLPPIGERATHVRAAGQMQLGVADRARIDVKQLRP